MHFLQTYDELVVGYTESRHFGDSRAAAIRAVWKERNLPNSLVLMNGGIAGHWTRTLRGNSIKVEFLSYVDPKRGDQRALEAAAAGLGRFLGRPVTVETSRL